MAATHEGTMTTYLYAGLGGLFLILGGLLWWRGSQLEHARGELTAYKAAQAQAVADSISAAQIKAQEAEKRNAAVMADLQGKIDGSVADGVRLAVRLRSALADLHASPMPANPGQPGPAPASGGASSAAEIERLADNVRRSEAAAWAAGERDGTRLDGLISEIKPQL